MLVSRKAGWQKLATGKVEDVGIDRRQQGQPGLIRLFGCLQVD